MRVADDIHEHVLDLTLALVNTHHSGGAHERARLYQELHDYCELVASDGRDHPFLWESLADFTDDDRAAIGFYSRALKLAMEAGALDHQASIRFALAQRHLEIGENAIAYGYAGQANDVAIHTGDLDLRREISQFLLDHSTDG